MFSKVPRDGFRLSLLLNFSRSTWIVLVRTEKEFVHLVSTFYRFGHVLTVAVALLLAILTGRSDLCIAGVFGAGKTRSLAVLLIALSCELDDFYAVVYTKENVAAKALADQISDLSPPTQSTFGGLLGRIEEGKGEAYATKIDVRCSDRNRVIAEKRILIATGGSATAEMAMKYSSFSLWLSRMWVSGSMVWRTQNSYDLLSGGCNRPNRSSSVQRFAFVS